jgi:hypothetical protein
MSKPNTVHFPTLSEKRPKSVSFSAPKYATEVGTLREEFKSRFQDFTKHKTSFRIFASPFEVDVEAVPEKFQMRLIDCQSREEMKPKFVECISSGILQTLPS